MYENNPVAYQDSPGKVEAFGIAVFNFLLGDLKSGNMTIEEAREILPKSPSVTDIMSVWEQNNRSSAQWDGNIENSLIRNLGAAVGVAGDPRVVNFENGVSTTNFVNELPAPAYPFEVDMGKAFLGKLVYDASCQGCHESQAFMKIDDVGTDKGRALGLTVGGRQLLIAGLRATCPEDKDDRCNATDEEIIADRQSEGKAGYTAIPLSGLWARAPYLHNGSVPDIYSFLVPSARPAKFFTGNLKFNKDRLGYISDETGSEYDTNLEGYSNLGHSDKDVFFGGIDFELNSYAREVLTEYLKTL